MKVTDETLFHGPGPRDLTVEELADASGPPDADCCAARGPTRVMGLRYLCVRSDGHGGRHVATGDDTVLEVWS